MKKEEIYLKVLSKIMREEIQTQSEQSYNNLRQTISSQFLKQLKKIQYPKAPFLQLQIETMFDTIDNLYLYPELLNKPCVSIQTHQTNKLFYIMKELFDGGKLPTVLSNNKTQIPFFILHGCEEEVDILNYANFRIKITIKELIILIAESGKRGISLNKIIKAIFIKTPLKLDKICVLFDNSYKTGKNLFPRSFHKHFLFLESNDIKYFSSKKAGYYNGVICNENTAEEIKQKKLQKQHNIISKTTFYKDVLSSIAPVYLGLSDEFDYYSSMVIDYYKKNIDKCKKNIQLIKADNVISGSISSQFSTLIENRKKEEEACVKRLENELKTLNSMFHNLECDFNKIKQDLDDVIRHEKYVSQVVFDFIFMQLFIENTQKNKVNILQKLDTLGYDDCDLFENYFKKTSNKSVKVSLDDIRLHQWEKAKIYLELTQPSQFNDNQIRRYLKILGQHISTGKEFYLKSLQESGRQKIQTLKISYDSGYQKAGDDLLQLLKDGEKGIDIKLFLSNLNPEACYMLTENNLKEKNKSVYSLTDYRLTHLKIAASQKDSPSIGMIVDCIYDANFSNAIVLKKNNFEGKETANTLVNLCRYLLNANYKVKHYSEILGVLLFCLNEKHSESYQLLSGIESGVANYCKGVMHQDDDNHSVVNLPEALRYYEKANESGFFVKGLDEKIEYCKQKILDEELDRANQYKKNNVYSSKKSDYTQINKSSGCIITTATCLALNKGGDCYELNLLRKFRDDWVETTDNGEILVREYYRVSQLILEKISQMPNSEEIYTYLWVDYILPTCKKIEQEQFLEATKLYISMIMYLCNRFQVELTNNCKQVLKVDYNLDCVDFNI